MSTNSRRSKRTPRNAKVTAVRPDASHQKSALADAANDVTVAMPAPATPSGGTGPQPNTRIGTSAMCRSSAAM